MSRSHPPSSHQSSPGAASDHADPAPSEEAVACSRALARQHRVVPLRQEGGTLVIGAARPVSPAVRNEIAFATGHAIAVERVADERVAAYCGPDDHTPEATSSDGSSDPSPEPVATPESAAPEARRPAHADGGDMQLENSQQQDDHTATKKTANKQTEAPPTEQGAPRQAAASRRLQDLRVEGIVGEIRDQETAQIAIRAALTGHLVLSTLHTNDAPSAPGRLIDMGVYLMPRVTG